MHAKKKTLILMIATKPHLGTELLHNLHDEANISALSYQQVVWSNHIQGEHLLEFYDCPYFSVKHLFQSRDRGRPAAGAMQKKNPSKKKQKLCTSKNNTIKKAYK